MIIDDILKRFGLSYDDLKPAERETLHSWMEALDKNKVTLESVKTYVSSMKDSVEAELTKTSLNFKEDLFLKARLRNYLLLEAFLSTPEKAKKALEKTIAGIASPK